MSRENRKTRIMDSIACLRDISLITTLKGVNGIARAISTVLVTLAWFLKYYIFTPMEKLFHDGERKEMIRWKQDREKIPPFQLDVASFCTSVSFFPLFDDALLRYFSLNKRMDKQLNNFIVITGSPLLVISPDWSLGILWLNQIYSGKCFPVDRKFLIE